MRYLIHNQHHYGRPIINTYQTFKQSLGKSLHSSHVSKVLRSMHMHSSLNISSLQIKIVTYNLFFLGYLSHQGFPPVMQCIYGMCLCMLLRTHITYILYMWMHILAYSVHTYIDSLSLMKKHYNE